MPLWRRLFHFEPRLDQQVEQILKSGKTHEAAVTDVHGVGASEVESKAGAQAKVDAHGAATTGVHGVGASEVESKAGAQAKADAVRADLNAHTTRTDNPHVVTAAQVGAPTQAAFDAKFDPTTGAKHTGAAGDGPKLTHDAIDTAAISAFRAYQSAAQSIPAGVTTRVAFQAEEYDHLDEYDSPLYRFTAKNPGIYAFSTSIRINSLASGSRAVVFLFKNGVPAAVLFGFASGATAIADVGGATRLKLNADDYVEVHLYLDTAHNTLTGSICAYFEGCRIA